MDISAVLFKKFANAQWSLNDNDYTQLEWLSESPKKPTLAKLKELWPEVESAQLDEAKAKIAARESALAKLAALGLTEAEVAAL